MSRRLLAVVLAAIIVIGAVGTATTAANDLSDSFANDTTHPFP